MPVLYSVSDVAKQLGCRPRDISDGFYSRLLDEAQVLVVASRRLIPAEYVPEIRAKLAKAGKLKATGESAAR